MEHLGSKECKLRLQVVETITSGSRTSGSGIGSKATTPGRNL